MRHAVSSAASEVLAGQVPRLQESHQVREEADRTRPLLRDKEEDNEHRQHQVYSPAQWDQGPTISVLGAASGQVERMQGTLQKTYGGGSLNEETVHLRKIGGRPRLQEQQGGQVAQGHPKG